MALTFKLIKHTSYGFIIMEEYSNKVIGIGSTLVGGIGVLWREWRREVKLNREDNKEYAKILARNIEVVARCEQTLDRIDKKLDNE